MFQRTPRNSIISPLFFKFLTWKFLVCWCSRECVDVCVCVCVCVWVIFDYFSEEMCCRRNLWNILSVLASLVVQMVKNLPAMQDTRVQFLGREDPLEEEMATHSSILAWRITRTEEPGRLQSTVSHRVENDWSDLACTYEFWFPKTLIWAYRWHMCHRCCSKNLRVIEP